MWLNKQTLFLNSARNLANLSLDAMTVPIKFVINRLGPM